MKRALMSVVATVFIFGVATAARADCHHGGHGYSYGHCYSAPRVNYYTPTYAAPCYSPPPCYAAPAAPPCQAAGPCQAAAAPQQAAAPDPSVSVLISLLAELLKANNSTVGR